MIAFSFLVFICAIPRDSFAILDSSEAAKESSTSDRIASGKQQPSVTGASARTGERERERDRERERERERD